MIFSCFKKEKVKIEKNKKDTQKVYQFFIRFLGITVQIIRDPNNSDLDNSNYIDKKEAIFLGIALSLDTIGIGIGISSSMFDINYFLFPFLVSCFELLFLSCGSFLGKKIKNISNIPENIWSILAGFLLIFIGVTKLIF